MPVQTMSRTAFHPLRVTAVVPLTDDAVAVSFDVPEHLREHFTFDAGQSLTLRRMIDGREERRTYSICAPAGAAPRIGVRVIPDGVFSGWLAHDVKAGDTVDVQAPRGSFRADASVAARHLCIAAGSGITPMLSIMATVLGNPDSDVTLLYGNRTTTSVMFAEELADLKNQYPDRLDLIHVLSREPRDAPLFSGRLDADRLRVLFRDLVQVQDVDHVWLCGPMGMLTDAQKVLEEVGVPPERIHVELFYVDEPPPQLRHPEAVAGGETSEVTVILDGHHATTPMPKSSTILDSAQRTRTDLPFACKGGVCGTCRAQLCAGEVDMARNYALEESEIAAGFILTCQSFPLSDRVTVDYDA